MYYIMQRTLRRYHMLKRNCTWLYNTCYTYVQLHSSSSSIILVLRHQCSPQMGNSFNCLTAHVYTCKLSLQMRTGEMVHGGAGGGLQLWQQGETGARKRTGQPLLSRILAVRQVILESICSYPYISNEYLQNCSLVLFTLLCLVMLYPYYQHYLIVLHHVLHLSCSLFNFFKKIINK